MKKKQVFVYGLIAVILALAFIACSGSGGGGKSLNSAAELKEYLDKQPANSPDKPIKVAMKVNEMMINDIAKVISEAGKYVSLNLSGSPLTEIPDEAFENCKTLAGITIPSSVTSIGYSAFSSCTSLTSITIPNSVTSIEGGAFNGCTSLTSITIPSSVTSIGAWAFDGTAWLNSQPDGLVYVNKILYAYKGTMPANTVINDIRADTIAITDGAFSFKENLTSVTIPNSVTSIGAGTFDGSGLTSVNIPNSVTSIGRDAFRGCSSLTSVTIPSSVTSIGDNAFRGCPSLTSVTFQGTIVSDNLGDRYNYSFSDDLHDKYLAGGIGTYTRSWNGRAYVWTKQ